MKFIFIIFTLIFNLLLAYASDQLFYCTDFSCQEPISTGKTLLRYSAKTDKHLSFAKNEDIKILSKPVDDGDDWIGFARGKVGLVPKSMVRELKIIKYDSQFKFPFLQLPFWGAPVKVKESSENYVETEEKPSNTPPILDIHPGTAPPSLLNSNEEQDEVDTASKLPTESLEEVAKNKEALADDPPEDTAKIEDTNQAPTDETQNSKPVEKEQPSASPKVVPEISPEEQKEQEVQSNNSVEIEAEKPIVPEVIKDELSKPENSEAQKVEAAKEELKDVEQGGVIPEELQDLPRDGSSEQDEEILDEGYVTDDEPQVDSELEDDAGEESDNEAEPEEINEPENSEIKTESKPVKDKKEPEPVEDKKDPEPVEDKKEPESVEVKKESEPVEIKIEASEIKSEPPEIKIEEPKVEESVEISTKEEPENIKESPSEPTESKNEAEAKKEEAVNEDENPEIESTTTSIFSAVKGFTSSVMNLLPEDLRDGEGTPSVTTEASEQVRAEPLQQAEEMPQHADSANKEHLEKREESLEKPSVMEQEVSKKIDTPVTTSLPENLALQDTPKSSATELPAEVTEELKLETTTSSVASEEPTTVPTVIPTEIPAIAPIVPNEKDDLQLTASPAPSESPVSESTPIPQVLQATTETATEAAPEVPVTEKPELTATEAAPEVTELPEVPPTVPAVEIPEVEESHHDHEHDDQDHDHHHHHHHHHHHKTYDPKDDSSSWSIIIVVKHLSGTLLSLLPEHLQDSILDVDSALVFTGIIALMLVSICVPYFVIESIVAVRPLKKQVVELNKSLWKVSAAYENQQEEFDTYKKKALAYDEDQKRIEQLEMELQILKKLEAKQKEQVKLLQKQLKTSAKAADGIEDLIEGSIKEKEIAIEERNRLQVNYNALQATLKEKLEELESAQASGSALALDLEVVNHERENLSKRLASLETELELTRSKLTSEAEIRRAKVEETDSLTKERDSIQAELLDLRRILHQYEENVSTMTDELTAKENELQALKETLGEDSPLIDISETKAKLKSAEEDAASLKSRCETVAFENASLTKNLEDTKTEFESVRTRKEEAENNLKVLEGYFKKKEEDLRTAVAKLELEQQIKHKDKDDLVKMIRDKESEVLMLISTNEGLKGEIEDMKGTHRNDLRKLESKADEHWLSLCQTERKYAEARKECELLRQKLVALAKEKDGGDDDRMSAIGDVPMYAIHPDMVPPPLSDDPAPPLSYFSLDDDFIPPPPLPVGSEPMRPPPLGRLSPTSPNNNYSSYMDDDDPISPIDRASAGGRGDYSEDSSGSDSPDHRRPGSRDNWINDNRRNDRHPPPNRRRRGGGGGGGGGGHHGNGPKTSSPLPHGVNC